MVHQSHPATGHGIIITFNFRHGRHATVPKTGEDQVVAGGGGFVGQAVGRGVIALGEGLLRVPISPTNELKSVTSRSVIDGKIVRDGRATVGDRSPGVTDHDVVIDDEGIGARIGDRAGLGLRDGEVGRSDSRLGCGERHALAPVKGPVGMGIIPRAIRGNEGKLFPGNRVVESRSPSGSGDTAGTIGGPEKTT